MLEENLDINSYDNESPSPKSGLSKNLKLILYLICLNIFTIITLTFIIVKLFIKDINDNKDNEDVIKVLKYDKDFLKPNITFNATF